MRLILITLTLFLVSCGHHDSAIDQTLVTAPTPLPNIYIDERGNSIKQDGWLPSDIMFGPAVRSSTGKAKLENGETIEIVIVQRSVLNTVIKVSSASDTVNDRYASAKAVAATSFGVVGKRPYCYVIAFQLERPPESNDNSWVTGPLMVKYCDLDGDGIFETHPKESNLVVPQWALSK